MNLFSDEQRDLYIQLIMPDHLFLADLADPELYVCSSQLFPTDNCELARKIKIRKVLFHSYFHLLVFNGRNMILSTKGIRIIIMFYETQITLMFFRIMQRYRT